jgi:RNA polymerase sigma-70 factor (ECF subfamily)
MDDLTSLLLAARDGDDISLAAWVRSSQDEVWRLCAQLVGPQAADDVTQDTYVRAWRALPAYRGDASARTWLLSIARRACADALRSRTRRRRLVDTLLRSGPRRAQPDVSGHHALHDLLTRLPWERRVAFVLTQSLGLSYAEVADICDCAIGTVRSRVARARAELMAQLAEQPADRPCDVPGLDLGRPRPQPGG